VVRQVIAQIALLNFIFCISLLSTMPVVYETPQNPGQQDLLREQEGIQPSTEDNAIASNISMMDNAELLRLRFLTNQLLQERGIQYGPPHP
jgi:hypothetical protein